MKINHPVTDREVLMKNGTILVTQTNLKGVITHVNDAFVEISGFSRDELMGSNHNIVRHPDMPTEVFKDLWECLKSEKPWAGLIKNRTKAGDFYWVDSNVTPVYKNGKPKGYLSVRYAPSRERISAAETLYQQLRAKTVHMRPKGVAALIKNVKELAIWKKAALLLVAFMIPVVYLLIQLYRAQDWWMLSLMSLISGLASVIGAGLVKQYIALLEESIGVFYRMADNRFRNQIELNRNDQIGDFHRALFGMQTKLNADLAHSKQVAADALRIKHALDNACSCVMVVNKDLDIIYMNETVQELFRLAEADIRAQLPEFSVDQLLGANIDQFHKNPSHQKNLLARLERSFASSLVIGNRHMDIVTNPVKNADGERLGYVVEWVDRTHEVRIKREIASIVDSVKSGQLDKRIELSDKEGFYATLSRDINELADVIEEVFNDVGSTMQAMANGDLTKKIDREYHGVYLACQNDINSTLGKLADIFLQIMESADRINSSSQEIASGNQDLSRRAELQATSLEETASSMAELTSTVANNADNAQQANRLADSARECAEQGGTIVSEAVASMQRIDESSKKVAQIISVIDEIAFQTNLLALNASVEAARAGEHGRGFAVVANEVRNLAQRSASAARESKELIQNSFQQVRFGTRYVNETGGALREIVDSVIKVGDIVAEIVAASVEQSTGIGQINQAISQLDTITQQNAALAEQTSAASLSMSEQSDAMMRQLAFFKLEDVSEASRSVFQHTENAPAGCDLALAKRKHLACISILRRFLDGEQTLTTSHDELQQDCDLGKWLDSTRHKKYERLPAMTQLKSLHKDFHRQVKACIKHKLQGNHEKALQIFQLVSDQAGDLVKILETIEPGRAAAPSREKPLTADQSAKSTGIAPYAGNLGLAEDDWEEF